MSTVFTHAFVAVAAGRVATDRPMPRRYWVSAIALSALPDADWLGYALGVPYEHPFGHRGFLHGLPFALVASLLTTLLLFRERRLFVGITLFLVAASHGVIDAMTDSGLGIALLAPFHDARVFLPFRPLPTPALSPGAFFGAHGAVIVAHEIARVWLPAAALCLAVEAIRALRRTAGPP